MGAPVIYNPRTTVIDMSRAVIKDADPDATGPAGICSSSAVTLYQSQGYGVCPTYCRTCAVFPDLIDFTNCDVAELAFNQDYAGYTSGFYYEGFQVGLIFNSGDISLFNPTDNNPETDPFGMGGALVCGFSFGDGFQNDPYFAAALPPRDDYPLGIPSLANVVNNGSVVDCSAGAFNGTSTLRARFRVLRSAPYADCNTKDGSTASYVYATAYENENTIVDEPLDFPTCAALFQRFASDEKNDASGTTNTGAAVALLTGPNAPLTARPFIRRLTFGDTAGHGMTIGNLSVTVGSKTSPPFWTDLKGCRED